MLNETPWVLDADNETRQKQLLADFFDDNLMQNRLTSVIDKACAACNAPTVRGRGGLACPVPSI